MGGHCTNPDDPFGFNQILNGVEILFGQPKYRGGGA